MISYPAPFVGAILKALVVIFWINKQLDVFFVLLRHFHRFWQNLNFFKSNWQIPTYIDVYFTYVVRMGRIPGSKNKRMWIREGDMVIANPWEIQDAKADVTWKYTRPQIEWLERKVYLNWGCLKYFIHFIDNFNSRFN